MGSRGSPAGTGRPTGDHAFSVAEHCLLVETIAGEIAPKLDRRFRLAALIHDAPEYVIGDLISPFKAALSLDYQRLREEAARRDPYPLRAAAGASRRHHQAD